MSDYLKRVLDDPGGNVTEHGAEDILLYPNPFEGMDLHTTSRQVVYLDKTRRSQYFVPDYMNSTSDIPVMQAAESLSDVFNFVLPDLRNDGRNIQMAFDNTGDYNFGAALTDWGMNTLDLNRSSSPSGSNLLQLDHNISSQNYSTLSQLEPILSQNTTLSASTYATLTPASQEESPIMSVERNDKIICYGMLHNIDVKLVGELKAIDTKLGDSTSYRYFNIKREQSHVLLTFPQDETDFGYLRSGVEVTLCQLLSESSVQFEPMRSVLNLRETIGNAKKSADAMVKVDINVYGPPRLARHVGSVLSVGKLWLQKPEHSRHGLSYENPHFLPVEIGGVVAQSVQPQMLVAAVEASKKTSRDQQLRKMVEEVYQVMDNTRHLEQVEGGDLVAQKLLKHQQEALGFMLERESGHISERYRLWEKIVLDDGREEYRHRITKAKRVAQPEERGGGILADEMGLGKSLSILALITKTLDNAQEWARHRNEDNGNTKLKHSKSTLVVVSSALLVCNWMNEVRKDKRIDLLQNSDIVVTTYNTLAAEHQAATKQNPSLLHQIGWYRVVLDEAHTIRSASTGFHHACTLLEANSRWCLTGTPIQNKLADIGALLAFIRADPFSKPSIFRKWIEMPFETQRDDLTAIRNRLVILLEAFCLRRTKEIIKLPKPRQTIRSLSFSQHEREQYEKTKKMLMRTIKQGVSDVEKGKFGLFQANLQMRILCNHGTYQKAFSWQRHKHNEAREAVVGVLGDRGEITCSVCKQHMPILGSSSEGNGFLDMCAHVLCAECIEEASLSTENSQAMRCPVCVLWLPGQKQGKVARSVTEMAESQSLAAKAASDNDDYYFDFAGHSTKMQALIEDVRKDLWTSKSVVFSCWTRTLHLFSRHLEDAKIPYLRVDGDCSLRQRQEKLKQFATDEQMPVLLMTTGTGAFGLNLTCANRVFIVELQWNPAVENQAVARAIRLGQENEVQVTRYVIKDTVEEEMMLQQQYKKQLLTIGFEDEQDLI